ncbi:polysaccharide deacetylase family protein [uncultured Novosphingobium sp.]|uniref:polysaccharide deacetylase family protein n=1 Tax=uncultured Novosphingobium sp. TaxID=292277 RepID=UPI0037489BF2
MPQVNLLERPSPPDYVQFAPGFGQRFLVTVDTEEEFDWTGPIRREGHTLHSVPAMATFQALCESHGVVPVYLVDYPIATSPAAFEAIGDAVAHGRAEVGVQLHPWVSPPFDEHVTEYNSYAGNLPFELERQKFRTLRDTIEHAFGRAPLIYRAGRYGLGTRTAEILAENGLTIDTSVRARFDYSGKGGPNYRDHPVRPYWIDRSRNLLELPLTTVFWGPLRQLGGAIYPYMWRAPSARGMLSRARLLERIPLTPEGVTADEAVRGIDIAVDEGLPVLVLSFHSPSLAPGFTPYVRDEADLARLYDWWRTIFAHLARRNVQPTSVADIMASVALA